MEAIPIILFLVSCICIYFYLLILGQVYQNWEQYSETLLSTSTKSLSSFSIIIPARNEAKNLPYLLESIRKLEYPKSLVEVIVIDDHSTDETLKLMQSYEHIQLIINTETQQGKKVALQNGISNAKNDWILCLDADVEVNPHLLKLYDQKQKQKDYKFIAGGVHMIGQDTWIERFQSLDCHTLMMSTCSGISKSDFYLANGANMCFSKEAFHRVNGFSQNEHIASGDDVFLIKKMAEHFGPESIGFLKSRRGAVLTKSEKNLVPFINQRLRWAGKTKHYVSPNLLRFQGAIAGFHILILSFIAFSYFYPLCFFLALLMYISKLSIDWMIMQRLAFFFDNSKAMKWFPVSHFLYFPYIIMMAIFSTGWFKSSWKGRKN